MSDFDSKDYGDRLRREIHSNVQDRIQRKMDRLQRKMERRQYRHSGRFGVVFGALIAGVGVLFLLQNLGILYFEDIWQYWPVILIVIGVSRAASSLVVGGRIVGGVMVFIGVIFLLENLGLIHGNVWRYLWPLALIAVGLGLLVRAVERHNLASGAPNPHHHPRLRRPRPSPVQRTRVLSRPGPSSAESGGESKRRTSKVVKPSPFLADCNSI